MNNTVIRELHNNVLFITLNNPENGNTVNNDNLSLLKDFLLEGIGNNECRVIVIEGKNGIFSRGMDFKNLLKNADNGIKEDFSTPYKDVVKIIRNSPKPVIGKIDGDVLAGGMGIALACDILIATKRSIFGLSEVLFGIIPAYVYPFLLERVSFKKARNLVLSSKRFDAFTAYELGIIDEVVEDDKIDKKLKEYLQRLLYSSPKALALTKKYADELTNNKIDEALDYAQKQLTELLNNKDNINTIKSFLEGEKPPWALSYKHKK